MAKTKIIHGKKKRKKYRHVSLEEIVGETLEAIGLTTTKGNWGDEPCLQLFFSNGKQHGIVLPADNTNP